jgi:hypothetical protein
LPYGDVKAVIEYGSRDGKRGTLRRERSEWLESWFPLGDGVADTSAMVVCPCCGERFGIVVDPGGAALQRYVEDCQICCRPLAITVRWSRRGEARVEAEPEEDM